MHHLHMVGVQSLHMNPTHCLLCYSLSKLSHFPKGDCVLSLSLSALSHLKIAAF